MTQLDDKMGGPERFLLKGPMPDLPKCKEWGVTTCAQCKREKCLNKKLKAIESIIQECQMWRNVWGWVPPEVKYYVARVGQDVGITMRNYKRYLGTLVDSRWELKNLELGVIDKVYDSINDQTYYEKKIVIISTSSIMDIQWIKERKAWEEFQAEATGVIEEVKPPAAESKTEPAATPDS